MIQRYALDVIERAIVDVDTVGSAHSNGAGSANDSSGSHGVFSSRSDSVVWWPLLPPSDKDAALREILSLASVADLANTSDAAPQPNWRTVLAACARSGAPNARELCRNWARQSPRYDNDRSFDTRFDSYAGSNGGITMGSLILIAYRAGWNRTGWRAAANSNNPSHIGPSTSTNVARQAGVAAPVTSIPSSLSAPTALAEMNGRFFLAHRWGNEPTIGYESSDGVCPVTLAGLRLMLANRFVAGRKDPVPLADWWLEYAQRREVDRVIYDPEGVLARPGERIFNLWTGFNVGPRPGLWSKMRRHLLDTVCKGDQTRFRYVLCWLAHAVRHPGTAPGTVLVLMSEAEGAGKTIVADWMVRMLGRHGIMLSTPEHLVGDFNDHLENRSFICLNEPAFPGDHAGARKFKSMITDATWLINGKYRKPYPVPNIAHIMLTTNAEWAVPAGNNARRFVVLDVDEGRVGDHAYFAALRHEADNGGIAAMLDFLLRLDISKCNLHAVPHTRALVAQQLLSANSQTQWALDAVVHGSLAFDHTYSSGSLYKQYSEYTKDRGQRPVSGITFGRWLGSCGFRRSTSHGSAQWDIPDGATFAAAVQSRAGIL